MRLPNKEELQGIAEKYIPSLKEIYTRILNLAFRNLKHLNM